MLGLKLDTGRLQQGWIYEHDTKSQTIECRLANLGYIETSPQRGFPNKGSQKSVEERAVVRPDLGPQGIYFDMNEQWVPHDIVELWSRFTALNEPKRENLFRAGNALLCAVSMWPDQRTAYATFLVVACEALKPEGKRHDDLNVYDVVASLLGLDRAEQLFQLSVRPQKVRNKLVHRGYLAAGEFLSRLGDNYFRDPSFDEMLRILSIITRTCLIEWLRCGGQFKAVRLPRAHYQSAAQLKRGRKVKK